MNDWSITSNIFSRHVKSHTRLQTRFDRFEAWHYFQLKDIYNVSAFLGPIHYWLFNKIQFMEERSFAVASYLQENGSKESASLKVNEYGDRLAGADLGEILGNNSIHNFLYGLISKVEIFEAGLMELVKDEKFDEVAKVVENHGRSTGQKLVEHKGSKPGNLEELYQLVADTQLEGMPCDPGAEVNLLDQNNMTYNHSTCNHIPNWEYTGCSNQKMCRIHNAWLGGFISGLNEAAVYKVEKTIADGASTCSAKITL